jgi:predicted CXXCH cytochrome family protein
MECHDGLPTAADKTINLHDPYAAGDCSDCHNPHASEGDLLFRTNRIADTCAACHDPADLLPKPEFAHTPVAEGRCQDCHDAHGSANEALLIVERKQVCWSCHDDMRDLTKWSNVHQPFAQGKCTFCHDPHGGQADQALKAEPKDLCTKCHSARAGKLDGKHRGFPMENTDCASCHAPHAAKSAGLPHEQIHPPFEEGDCSSCHVGATTALVDKQPAVCLTCHVGMAEDLKLGTLHAPLREENACTVCHSPHTAPLPPLLPRKQTAVCGSCHQEQASAYKEAAYRHPQVNDKDCTTCHDPHLVRESAPGTEGPPREVCLSCHTHREHSDHPLGENVIDPRTGGLMNCNSCHDPHGTGFPKFLVDDPQGKLCIQCHTDKLRPLRK